MKDKHEPWDWKDAALLVALLSLLTIAGLAVAGIILSL
jgi:hypothetical protein